MSFHTGVCNFCGTGCGHFIQTSGNTIVGVAPSQKHPVSKGELCVRGWHIHELLRTDERIDTPLVKKNGKLEATTYDEAIAIVANKLSELKAPAEELAFFGSARASNEDNYLLMKMARAVFHTNNLSISSESGHRNSLNVLYKGTGMAGALGSLAEIAKAKYILVVGTDITKLNPIMGSNIHKAAMHGTHLTTICSTKTQIAKLSKVHLQQKPGTKRVVLDALAKVILEEKLYDDSFGQSTLEGFKEYSAFLKSLTQEQIVSLTGIPYEEIKKEAKNLAKAESILMFFSSGISGLDEDTIISLFNLFALAGKIGKEGSGIIPAAGICNLQGSYDMGLAPDLMTGFRSLEDSETVENFHEYWGKQINKTPGKGVYELLADDTSKLKSLVVVDHDEGIVRYAERIKKLGFVVYIGAFSNKFMEYADVVLPIAAYSEDSATYTCSDRRVQLATKKIEPPKDVVPAWKLYMMIANKLAANWSYASASEVFDEIALLTPTYAGISHEKLDNGFGIQWPCNNEHPSGLARYEAKDAKTKLKFICGSGTYPHVLTNAEYNIALMVGKSQHYWHQNNLMRKTFIPKREFDATLLLYPEGYVEICAEDAKKLQVRNKWLVKVVSAKGSMKIAIKISEDVQPGTAYIPYFIQNMISDFLIKHHDTLVQGEEAVIPIKIEKV